MIRPAVGWLLVLLLAGCSSTGAVPVGGATPAPATGAPALSSSPPAPLPPPPSDGFSGPGAFSLSWQDVMFAPAPCPSGHPLASCFAGTASAKLPIIGQATLARSMIAGDGPGTPPSGCVTVVSDGTLTSTTGVITFHASGNLCGRVGTYVVATSTGSGSLAGFQLQGLIVNDSITEEWTGQIIPVR